MRKTHNPTPAPIGFDLYDPDLLDEIEWAWLDISLRRIPNPMGVDVDPEDEWTP